MRPGKKILILLICLLPIFAYPQSESAERKQKKLERLTDKKDEQALKDYQKAIRKHHKIQGKDTRKHMKESLKKSKQIGSGKRKKFFLTRWFSGD